LPERRDTKLRVPSWKVFVVRHAFALEYGCTVVAALAGLVAFVIWRRGVDGGARAAISVAAVAAGTVGALIPLTRRWRRQAIEELRRTVGDRDPGGSPVAWISDETWRRENAWDPGRELIFGHDRNDSLPCVDDPAVVIVAESERAAAPVVPVPEGLAVPATGSPGAHEAALKAAPPAYALRIFSPRWPVCCDRLATLVGLDGLDHAFASVLGTGLGEGTAVFHCRACGRVHLGEHHP
jgi:hypothetical protein